MQNSEPQPKKIGRLSAYKSNVLERWARHKLAISIIWSVLAFIFVAIPGLVNAVTGVPFADWLKDKGINMAFTDLILWGFGIGLCVILFRDERKLAKESKLRFSWIPWVFIAGFMLVYLFEGLYKKPPRKGSAPSNTQALSFASPIQVAKSGVDVAKWANDTRPVEIEKQAIICYQHKEFANALTLFRAKKSFQRNQSNGVFWGTQYPYYAGVLFLTGNKTEGRREFQTMVDEVNAGQVPYDNWDAVGVLLTDMGYLRDDCLVNSDTQTLKIFDAVITNLKNAQKKL
jgi:hypothetical protein